MAPKLLLQPCQGLSAASSSRARRDAALSASLPAAGPALAAAAPSRDKPSPCPARPADKESCEDAVSLPAFVAPHLSCSQFSAGTCQRGPGSAAPAPLGFIGGNTRARRDGPRTAAD